jgi:hypothetical protein
MRISRAVLALGAMPVLATPLLSGCGHHSPDPAAQGGPLGGAAHGGSVYACAAVGQPVTFGLEQFTNRGRTALVLDRAGLRDTRGVHLIGQYAILGTNAVGVTRGWPPRFASRIPPLWVTRRPVSGFRLAAGQTFNLVLGVEGTARPRGGAPGLVIRYHDAAGRFVVNDHLGMSVITGRCPG